MQQSCDCDYYRRKAELLQIRQNNIETLAKVVRLRLKDEGGWDTILPPSVIELVEAVLGEGK